MFCWHIQSRGLNFYGERFVSHRTWNPSSGFWGSEQEHFSDYFTGSRTGKSDPLLWGMENPDVSSVLVLTSGLCNMKCLGVMPLFSGWDSGLSQVTPSFLSGCPHNWSDPFPLLGGEGYWESQVSCLRT